MEGNKEDVQMEAKEEDEDGKPDKKKSKKEAR